MNVTTKIDENLNFLLWLYDRVLNGYLPLLNVTEMKSLVDTIVRWYEIKYPNKNSIVTADGQYTFMGNNSTESMQIGEFLESLSGLEQEIFRDNYRLGRSNNFEKNTLTFYIKDEFGISHRLEATTNTGELIGDLGIFAAVKPQKEALTIEELHEVLKSCSKYDTSELDRIVDAHICDETMRKMLLRTITLAMSSSKKSLPRVAEARTEKWIEEISAYCTDLFAKDHPKATNQIDFASWVIPERAETSSQAPIKKFITKKTTNKIHSQILDNCRSFYK